MISEGNRFKLIELHQMTLPSSTPQNHQAHVWERDEISLSKRDWGFDKESRTAVRAVWSLVLGQGFSYKLGHLWECSRFD